MGIKVQRVEIPYTPREQFEPFHDRATRYAVIVAHRRAGKTVACINELIKAALQCDRPNPRFAYVAPLYKQAKDVAWQYLLDFTAPIPEREANISELRVTLPNGATIRLYGADNPDTLRGIYLDGVILDEFADMSPRLWGEVIRPALADRKGWAVFIGTPKGHNGFYDLWEATRDDPAWFRLLLKASQTGIVDAVELEAARQTMGDDQFRQEFECSFEAAIVGSYFGRLLEQAELAGRFVDDLYDPSLPVHTAWDLGVGDSTAIWFFQVHANEIRFIDHYEASGVGADHYVEVVEERGYRYATHWLPHDAKVREWTGAARTRIEFLQSMGLTCGLVADHKIDDGINAARLTIEAAWFDRTKCHQGLEALKLYRRKYDEDRKVFLRVPLHDWTSHSADAFRYAAMTWREMKAEPIKSAKRGMTAEEAFFPTNSKRRMRV